MGICCSDGVCPGLSNQRTGRSERVTRIGLRWASSEMRSVVYVASVAAATGVQRYYVQDMKKNDEEDLLAPSVCPPALLCSPPGHMVAGA